MRVEIPGKKKGSIPSSLGHPDCMGGGRVVRVTRKSGPQSENSLVLVKHTRNIIGAKIKLLKAEILFLTVYNNDNDNVP
jgi:hypothetical protein